jgi:hypothetical protein
LEYFDRNRRQFGVHKYTLVYNYHSLPEVQAEINCYRAMRILQPYGYEPATALNFNTARNSLLDDRTTMTQTVVSK